MIPLVDSELLGEAEALLQSPALALEGISGNSFDLEVGRGYRPKPINTGAGREVGDESDCLVDGRNPFLIQGLRVGMNCNWKHF